MNPNRTEIILCVDRSGSMSSIASDMEGGLRTLISEQAKQPGECLVTLARFDTGYDVVFTARPAAEIKPNEISISPRGSTALLDAMARTIDDAGRRFAAMPEEERPGKVMLVVITDGMENASKEFTRSQVFDRVTRQREVYKWEIVFLGANQDAITVGHSLGIVAHSSATYDANAGGARAMVGAVSARACSYRGGVTGQSLTAEYKSRIGDKQ